MWSNIERAKLELDDDQVLRMNGARGLHIQVISGYLWLTLDGDPRDYVLRAGNTYLVERQEALTASAFRGPALVGLQRPKGVLPCFLCGRAPLRDSTLIRHARGWRGALQRLSLSSVALG